MLHSANLGRNLDDVFREARTLRKLSHPAIIGVRDCEYADPAGQARPYIVMDYFAGVSLEEFVRERGTISPNQLVALATQIAQGMKAAHHCSIFHRDLKPDNILVRKEGERWQVKIIDFGLAMPKQVIATSRASVSGEETVLGRSVAGTLQYAPPEQLGRLPGVQIGPYSDVYAFGKTCCYALFRTTEPKRRPWGAIPEQLADVLERCIEQELEHRPADFDPVLQALSVLHAKGNNLKAEHDPALQSDPKDTGDYTGRGEAHSQKVAYDQAVADFDQALRLDPDNAAAYLGRATVLNTKGEYDRAIADFDQALRLDPNKPAAYALRAAGHSKKGDYDRAVADLDQALIGDNQPSP